jgi:hypothetical protein
MAGDVIYTAQPPRRLHCTLRVAVPLVAHVAIIHDFSLAHVLYRNFCISHKSLV